MLILSCFGPLLSSRRFPMFRAQHAIVSLVVGSAIAVMGGCSDDTKATPQVIFQATTEEASGKDCRDSGTLFTVGSFGNASASQPSVPIQDGQASGQGTASIACSVTPAG